MCWDIWRLVLSRTQLLSHQALWTASEELGFQKVFLL